MGPLSEMSEARRRRTEASFHAVQALILQLISSRRLMLAAGFAGVSVVCAALAPPVARIILVMVASAALLVWGLAASRKLHRVAARLYDVLLAPPEPEPEPDASSQPYPVWLSSPEDARNLDHLDRILRWRGDDLVEGRSMHARSIAAQLRLMVLTATLTVASLVALLLVVMVLFTSAFSASPAFPEPHLEFYESLSWMMLALPLMVAGAIGNAQLQQFVLVVRSAQKELFLWEVTPVVVA